MRLLPKIFKMRDPTHDKDDIDRPITNYLISNINVIILRIARLGFGAVESSRRRCVVQRYSGPGVSGKVNPGANSFHGLSLYLAPIIGQHIADKPVSILWHCLDE